MAAVCNNPFRSIIVRAIEIVYACEEALRLIAAYELPDAASVPVEPRAELRLRLHRSAARHLLAPLRVRSRRHDPARRVSCRRPRRTSRASKRISMAVAAPLVLEPDDVIRYRCEQSIRNYDPCISCSTHFLKLSVHRT